MKKEEKSYRSRIVELLKPAFAFAVENYAHDGCPDICCPGGWLEVKIGKINGPNQVKVEVRPAQRIWLRHWANHGGKAWVITIANNEWWSHAGAWAAEYLGVVKFQPFRDCAVAHWTKEPTTSQLVAMIVGNSSLL